MSPKEIKIGIIGAGSIGTLFGGYLATIKSKRFSTRVILFTRKNHVNAINENGLIIEKGTSILKIKENIEAVDTYEDLNEKERDFDFIFLTTKAHDISRAMAQYKKIIDSCDYVVILQNGIGNEEIVARSCEKHKIIRGVTSNGALLNTPGRVIHTGFGITKIGIPFQDKGLENKQLEALNLLKEVINAAGLETSIVDDIMKECWEKIFVNIGINAIGALTRLRNGELLEHEGLKILMAGAIEEALMIAEKKKIKLSKKDYVKLSYSIAEKTSQNMNSMLQDITKGKKTEIDFINGKIVNYARELGIKVPINTTLTHLIKGLEKKTT